MKRFIILGILLFAAGAYAQSQPKPPTCEESLEAVRSEMNELRFQLGREMQQLAVERAQHSQTRAALNAANAKQPAAAPATAPAAKKEEKKDAK